MKLRFSPAIAIACLALFLALGGTAVAAKKYLITSTKQIKPSVLRGLQGDDGADGAAGPQGPQGAAGPQGPAGAAASLAGLTTVNGPKVTIPADDAASSTATCPAGSRVVSGGGAAITLDGMAASQASADRQSWFVVASNSYELSGTYVQAVAYCASSGAAVTSRSVGGSTARTASTATHEQVQALVDGLQAQLTQQR